MPAPAFDCQTCGQTHERGCHGHVMKKGPDGRYERDVDGNAIIDRPCEKTPRKGQNICHHHGGNAPQNVTAAARREAREKAEKAFGVELERMGDAELSSVDPLIGLLRAVQLAAFAVDYFRRRVAQLDEVFGENHLGDETAHVLVELLGSWSERLARFSKLALDAGVAERQVQLAEQQGAILADILRRVFDDPEMGLTAKQRAKAIPVAARHLRAVGT